MKKLLVRLVILLVVVGVGLYLARNAIARRSVEIGVKTITGFPMEIASVDVGLFTSKLAVRGVQLKNPPDFPEPLFVDMPQLYVDYRLPSLLTGGNHINDILINIDHLVLVKNNKGESNVQKIQSVVASDDSKPKTKTKYQLDQLRIHVGKVTIKDYSHAKPTERTLTLNLDRTYNNISDSTDITRLVLMSIAGNVSLPDFGINPAELTKGLGNVTDAAGKAIGKTGKGLFETIKKAVPQK